MAVHHYKAGLIVPKGMRNLVDDINDGVLALYCIERVTRLISEERYHFVCLFAKKNEQ